MEESPDIPLNEEEEANKRRDEEEQALRLEDVESAATIETDTVEDINKFINSVRSLQDSSEKGSPGDTRGEKLEHLISTLPKTNGKCGQGHTKGGMLKALKFLKVDGLDRLNNKTVSNFRAKNEEPVFWELIRKVVNDGEPKERLLVFTGVLASFVEAVKDSSQDNSIKSSSPSVANRVALMAHTVADPEAVNILEAIANGVSTVAATAVLDSQGGSKAFLEKLYTELAELADKNKNTYDNKSNYTEVYCGKDGAEALAKANIDPSKALKMTGADFKKLFIESKNQFDILVSRHDVSGEYRDGVERRANIFDNFIGVQGRAKDISLFYLFLTWDGIKLKYASRRLAEDQGKSSSSSSTTTSSSDVTPITAPSAKKLSKREREEEASEEKKIKRMAAVAASLRPAANNSAGNAELDASRIELIQSKIAETANAVAVQKNVARLTAMSNTVFFESLTTEQKEKLRGATFNSLF